MTTALKVCELPGHEWMGNQHPHEHCPDCGSDDFDRGNTATYPKTPLFRFVCRSCWAEWTSKDDEPAEEDTTTHRVRILAPTEAIEANERDTLCCIGCAAKLAEAYIGFGWDISVIGGRR